MSRSPDWLVPLVTLAEHGGDSKRYIEAVYSEFYRDFIQRQPVFQGEKVVCGRQIIEGKERTFWHVVSEGDVEVERTPDMRRCERIRWIRQVIEHAGDPAVLSWPSARGRSVRQVLWVREADFVVILEKRPGCWWLWTTYQTDRPYTRARFQREYEEWLKSQRRP